MVGALKRRPARRRLLIAGDGLLIQLVRLPQSGFSSEYRHPLWYGKTRMVSLPDDEKNSKISLFVLAQLTNVTDRQTPGDSKDHAYAYASRGKNCSLH